ncbi:hypothetical protein AURDEDRAFT_153794 [Auricularia subglabra TFB-10046 SS5]|uniref:Uncharacterized protein n=1 Tax=Auricularia subglabra (strain TFB-10046 / SS5) TaxID=717982 RepID=J0D1F8_AURST|nr:hypothetical protein AURDEDRAFT_153794 [Auricularia subglabra TFB-10046 SS5]
MSAQYSPYNVTLLATSPLFSYRPSRDGDVTTTWNASYTGKDVWPAQVNTTRGAGVGYRRTQSTDGAEISLSFDGTGLYACFTSSGAQFTMTLDNSAVPSNSGNFVPAQNDAGACAGFGAETAFAAPNLQSGTHSMLLRVQAGADKEFRFFGGVITIGINANGINAAETIDDQDAGWVLSPGGRVSAGGTWDTTHEPTYYSKLYDSTGTFQCSYGQDATATYTFSGAGGLVLRGPLWYDTHSFSITLDNTTYNMDATTSWEDGSNVLFATGALDPAAVHRLVVLDYSASDPGCNLGRPCCVGIDSLLLLRPESNAVSDSSTTLDPPAPSTTEPPDSAALIPQRLNSSHAMPPGAIIGTALGGLAAILAAVLLFVILRARRRQRMASRLGSPSDTTPYTLFSGHAVGTTLLISHPRGTRGSSPQPAQGLSPLTPEVPVRYHHSRAMVAASAGSGVRGPSLTSTVNLDQGITTVSPLIDQRRSSATYSAPPHYSD